MKNRRLDKYIILLLSVIFVSCITNQNTRYLQHIKGVSYSKAATPEYKIKINDEINIIVFSMNSEVTNTFFSNSQVSYSYRVYSDGTIDIPFIHKIKIEGLTLREAKKEIDQRLKESIPDAEIKISILNKFFYIIGEGKLKGAFSLYKENVNIFEALALGKDLNKEANLKKVKIVRENNGKKSIVEFDLRSESIIDSEYYYIQPDDIIYISRSKKGFYKLNSFSSFLGMISSSFTFALLVINYSK